MAKSLGAFIAFLAFVLATGATAEFVSRQIYPAYELVGLERFEGPDWQSSVEPEGFLYKPTGERVPGPWFLRSLHSFPSIGSLVAALVLLAACGLATAGGIALWAGLSWLWSDVVRRRRQPFGSAATVK
ncbi:MAG: hypothetical protein IPM29_18205 [Planctomycetes bacterium]|nr:hypothetical protein [Planctomycetota bacterium]